MKVYVIVTEYQDADIPESFVESVFDTEEKAKKYFQKSKRETLKNYIDCYEYFESEKNSFYIATFDGYIRTYITECEVN